MTEAASRSDRAYLSRAVELAKRAAGSTAPNPVVGAVVVRDGQIIGEGFHHRAGEAHAETLALEAAGDARGATLYVTLEPCNHSGRTEPCSELLRKSGLARVVVGTLDPDSRTNGGGVAALREHKIQVDVLDDAACVELIAPFATTIRAHRPAVTLKLAASLDGYIAPEPGTHWLSGEAARSRVRELRIEHDAVMVGSGTVKTDDPQLTVRPSHRRHKPYLRIVVCGRTPPAKESRVLAVQPDAGTILAVPLSAKHEYTEGPAGVEILALPETTNGYVSLPVLMSALHAREVASVLCEGGPTLARSLLEERLVDRLLWFATPALLASDKALPALNLGPQSLAQELFFETCERVGEDVLIVARLRHV